MWNYDPLASGLHRLLNKSSSGASLYLSSLEKSHEAKWTVVTVSCINTLCSLQVMQSDAVRSGVSSIFVHWHLVSNPLFYLWLRDVTLNEETSFFSPLFLSLFAVLHSTFGFHYSSTTCTLSTSRLFIQARALRKSPFRGHRSTVVSNWDGEFE